MTVNKNIKGYCFLPFVYSFVYCVFSTVNKAKKIAQPGTKWFKAENGTKRSVNLCRSFVQNPTTHLFEQF